MARIEPAIHLHLLSMMLFLRRMGTLTADFNRSRNVLERVNWYRLIVDEGAITKYVNKYQRLYLKIYQPI